MKKLTFLYGEELDKLALVYGLKRKERESDRSLTYRIELELFKCNNENGCA